MLTMDFCNCLARLDYVDIFYSRITHAGMKMVGALKENDVTQVNDLH